MTWDRFAKLTEADVGILFGALIGLAISVVALIAVGLFVARRVLGL